MKCVLLMLTFLNYSFLLHAQTAEDSVRAVINTLFAGMKNGDAGLVTSAFAENAVLQTITRNKEGKMTVVSDDVDDFDILWTPYNFFYYGKFSHCGVNSFQLVRFDNGWKIQYLIDTRRRQGCVN